MLYRGGLEKKFVANLIHPSHSLEEVNDWEKACRTRNPDIEFINPFFLENLPDLHKVKARVSGNPFPLQEGEAKRTVKTLVEEMAKAEGSLYVLNEHDSIGGDFQLAYSILLGLNPTLTVCQNERYIKHPWLDYYSRNIFNSLEEFEEKVSRIVMQARKGISNHDRKMQKRSRWMRSLLELSRPKIKEPFTFYIGHATQKMIEVRAMQLRLQEHFQGMITFHNPYYELKGGDLDRKIEDAVKNGEKPLLPGDFARRVVHKDTTGRKSIRDSNGLFIVIDNDYSIGREIEILNGNLLRANPIIALCLDRRKAHHPMIAYHTDTIFQSEEETVKKLPMYVEKAKQEKMNKRLEEFNVWIKDLIKRSDQRRYAS